VLEKPLSRKFWNAIAWVRLILRASSEAAYDRTEAKLTLRDSRSPSAPQPYGLVGPSPMPPMGPDRLLHPKRPLGSRGISLDVRGCRQKRPMAKAHTPDVYVTDATGGEGWPSHHPTRLS
jgi:hypothetical protein